MESTSRPHREDLEHFHGTDQRGDDQAFCACWFRSIADLPGLCPRQRQPGEVKLLPIEGLDLRRELAVIYRKDRNLPMGALKFLELASERLLHRGGVDADGRNGVTSGL